MFRRITIAAALFAAGITASHAESLFLDSGAVHSFAGVPSANADSAFAGDRKIVQSRSGMRFNPAAASAQDLSMTLPDGQSLSAKRINRYTTASGSTVWIGKHAGAASSKADSAGEETVLVLREGRVTGSLRHAGKLYRIRSTAEGSHTLAEVDASRFPPDHKEDAYQQLVYESKPATMLAPLKSALSKPEIASFDQQLYQAQGLSGANAQFDAVAGPVIRVLVNYTAAAKAAAGDIAALIDLSIAETNQGYVNSGVSARLELAHVAAVTYTQSGTQSVDRDRYASPNDGYMDEIHTQRNTYAADVAVLVVDDGDESCGIAKAIGATEATAFAAVHWDCSTGNLSFGHELGHLYGARHNPENDGNTLPYAYGHGYWAPNAAWRTIMAYPCSAKACPRLNYWSSPSRNYTDGQAMGTAANSDNTRVLNARAAVLAEFRPAPGSGGVTVTNNTVYAIPDNNATGVQSPVSIASAGVAGNVSVSVNIVHPYIGDLVVELIAPNNAVYTLQSRIGGSADNIVKTYAVSTGALSRVGTWKLRVSDRANADVGSIQSWTLTTQ